MVNLNVWPKYYQLQYFWIENVVFEFLFLNNRVKDICRLIL